VRKSHTITLPPGLWDELEKVTGRRHISSTIEGLINNYLAAGRREQRIEALEAEVHELRAGVEQLREKAALEEYRHAQERNEERERRG
jgi:hypothetical protein